MADTVLQMTVLALTFFVLCSPSLQQDPAIFNYSSPSEIVNSTGGRIRGAKNRNYDDFVLGGLFSIHMPADGVEGCGAVRHERGLERMEAMLFAIDMINADDAILQGFTLGYDIRDTCSIENIGLDEAVDLVITNSQHSESCPSLTELNITMLEGDFQEAPTSGIVGAASSHVSVPVANLARLFKLPQVSYASSSVLLSNRDRYDYFYRTIPPDDFQAQAMLDIILHFNWSHVSTIYSRNAYGEPGINKFKSLAKKHDICIDIDDGIDDDFSTKNFRDLAVRLIESEANVVILFTSQENAVSLFKQIVKTTTSRRFTWIASDAWAGSISVARNYTTTIAGLIGFVPLTEYLESFHKYFSKLTLDSNLRNPWFEEFLAAVKNCSTLNENPGKTPCNRTSSVTDLEAYKQGNKIPLVIDAVYTFAIALDNFLTENCKKPIQWFSNNRTCLNQMRKLNGSALLEYIKKVNFTSPTGERIMFDDKGNVDGRYEILNYQAIYIDEDDGTRKREFVFKTVGKWGSFMSNKSSLKSLQFFPEISFQFGLDSVSKQVITSPPESQCGRCKSGQIRRQVKSSCCGLCDSCLGKFFSRSPLEFNCSECEEFSWGNNPTKGSNSCEPIKQSSLSHRRPYSIIIMIIAVIGLVFVIFTLMVFQKFWNTPIVKSSGREQMITLLVAISFTFISVSFYFSPLTTVICGIQRWIMWTSFATMFGAFLVKTVRFAHIFLKRRIMWVRITHYQYQLLFTLILVILQWIILAISLTVIEQKIEIGIRLVAEMPNETPTVVVSCVSERIALLITSLGYETLLIILCTIFGTMNFNNPANFNEAKYIYLCSMLILVIWIAFVITFVATQNMHELQNNAISLAVVMIGYAVYLTIFGPRLFLLLFKRDKNVTKLSQPATIKLEIQNNVDVPQGSVTGEALEMSDFIPQNTPIKTAQAEKEIANAGERIAGLYIYSSINHEVSSQDQ